MSWAGMLGIAGVILGTILLEFTPYKAYGNVVLIIASLVLVSTILLYMMGKRRRLNRF